MIFQILESSSESSDSSETDSDADFLSDDDDVVEITNISCETILDSVDVKAEPKQEGKFLTYLRNSLCGYSSLSITP